MAPRLEKITPDNVRDACRLEIRPEQRNYVAPVAVSLAEAYAHAAAGTDAAWPRLVYDEDELVAFIMGGFDPDNEEPLFRCGIWRLNVAADRQGNGYGMFAVEVLLEEARARGLDRVTVCWMPGEHSPAEFYRRLGFRPTGQEFHGEIVGELFLSQR